MENNAEMVKEHGRSLANIFGRLSGVENNMAEVMAWKSRVDMDLYNHGGPTGMKTMLTNFISKHEAREDERERQRAEREKELDIQRSQREREIDRQLAMRDRKTNLRLAILGIIIALLTLLVGWKAYLDTAYHMKNGDLNIPALSHAIPPDPVVSFEHPQDVQMPSHP